MTTAQLVSTGSSTASYRYDASGSLLVLKDGSATTLFLPGEQLHASGSTITATRYYTLGGQVIAARTSPDAASSLYWLFPDQQGTTTVRINTGNQAVFHRHFTPYGTPAGAVPWWPGTQGYIGGTTDTTTGLTSLGAREYNLAAPAFISPDPVLNPADPADLDPYDYAYNNPATREDPAGLSPTGPNNCDPSTGCPTGTGGGSPGGGGSDPSGGGAGGGGLSGGFSGLSGIGSLPILGNLADPPPQPASTLPRPGEPGPDS